MFFDLSYGVMYRYRVTGLEPSPYYGRCELRMFVLLGQVILYIQAMDRNQPSRDFVSGCFLNVGLNRYV